MPLVAGPVKARKDTSFDPRIDTNVRTEARRLRAKLAEYYESEWLRIDLPKGGYALLFNQREAAQEREPAPARFRSEWLFAIILASLLCCAGIAWIYSRRATPRPQSVAVLPFVDLSPDRSNEYMAKSLFAGTVQDPQSV
jgi:hypothetical protein